MKLLALFLFAIFVSSSYAQVCGDSLCQIELAENAENCFEDCDEICPCRPYCEGRECGPDGCGGSCGSCVLPEVCLPNGECGCDRNCIGKECGDDGCNTGFDCDFCGPLQTCGADFLCRGECTPDCRREDGSLRECGNDGCFGSCGECTPIPGQDIRCRDGFCVCRPQCDLIECGSDGCGGDCGACEGDAECIEGFCVYPTLGCCGDGICDPFLDEDVCSCHTDCRGCCINDVCEELFGETEENCVQDCVDALLIEIRVLETDLLVQEQCSVEITGPNNFQQTLVYTSPSVSFEFQDGGFGTYTFVTDCPSYLGRTVSLEVTLELELITLYVNLRPLRIEVRDGQSNDLLNSALIVASFQTSSETLNWVNPSISWVPFAGYVTYTFETSSSGYLDNVETRTVLITDELITLFLFRNNLPFIVEDCVTGQVLSTSTVEATSSTYAEFEVTFTVSGSSTNFVHVGYGSYTFFVDSENYESDTFTREVTVDTEEIRVCLGASAFCGDGVCNGNEVALPTSADRCGDCGRIRGIISLAVGQKDQLGNITVSVWAHPTNPALFMRRGEPVPQADFTVVSDSKGSFSAHTLSFDAPTGSTAFGSYTRRFYFSLTGSFIDRTSGEDSTEPLLPLWWNYELTNLQYVSGSTLETNNSPSLYFYMTPEFPTTDALVRVILSWGTLIAQTATSIPDIDLVIAGPTNPESQAAGFSNGIVNFENKDERAGSQVLPYAKIITDSAQGFGPEVVDFYGVPGSSTLEIGFSDSYADDAAANVYEIWVDKPNSSANEELILTTISESNVFLVFYYNDGTENKQLLFDERTGVEHAYGFYNGDQWNQIDSTATLWHVVDIASEGVIFEGFPAEGAGAKYGFESGFFEPTKSIPCGHVSARGASPAYCPATLTYPQSKKK